MKKIFRRILAVMLCAVILAGAAAIGNIAGIVDVQNLAIKVSAESPKDDSGLYYVEFNGESLCITGIADESVIQDGVLRIPEKLSFNLISYNVRYIGSGAFYGVELKEVYFPDSVEELCDSGSFSYGCFEDTKTLQHVYFGQNSKLKTIGNRVFNNTGLVSVIIPASVTNIGESFRGCQNLEQVTFSAASKLQTIKDRAFDYCESLKSFSVPAGVTEIGNYAFSECGALSEFTFADGIKLNKIPQGMFSGCKNLTEINLPESITKIEYEAFYGCSLTEIKIPDSVEEIESGGSFSYGSFEDMKTLKNIYFGSNSSLKIIGERAFTSSGLTSLVLPASVRTIGNSFQNCSNLKTVKIKENSKLTTIGERAFSGCSKLGAFTVPASVTEIGRYAFGGCENLSSFVFENGIKIDTIPAGMFSGCESLTEVKLPDGIVTIDYEAFYGCSFSEFTLPDSVERLEGSNSFYYGSFEDMKSLKKVNISPDSQLKIIGTRVFNSSGIKTITLPSGITHIYESFMGCRSLESVTFASPSKLKIIDYAAFMYCEALMTVSIPASVETVDTNAFYGCESLSDVYYSSTKADWDKIEIKEGNDSLLNAKIHFASAQTIKVKANDLTLNYKQTGKLDYTVTPESDDYKVEYISSNEKIVTVDKNGNVKAAGKGTADITVKVTDSEGNEYKDTCKVTVKYTFVQWIIMILFFGWLWY